MEEGLFHLEEKNPKQYKSLVKFSKKLLPCMLMPTHTPVHTGRASEQVRPTGTEQVFNPQQSY